MVLAQEGAFLRFHIREKRLNAGIFVPTNWGYSPAENTGSL
jgi:hypothetical protein